MNIRYQYNFFTVTYVLTASLFIHVEIESMLRIKSKFQRTKTAEINVIK